jgi:hypothetical protein
MNKTEQAKRKVGRPATGKNKHIHTVTLDIGLLESIIALDANFKLSTFINAELQKKLNTTLSESI